MKSKSHKSRFTGIFDMDGKRIYNGDKIQVHDNNTFNKDKIIGTVVWRNGSYEFKGNHWCKYNIYAWRKSIQILQKGRKSVYELSDFDDLWQKWEAGNLNIKTEERPLIKKAFEDAFRMGQEIIMEQEL